MSSSGGQYGYGLDLGFKVPIPTEVLSFKGCAKTSPLLVDPAKRHIDKVMDEQDMFSADRYMYDNHDPEVLAEISQILALIRPPTVAKPTIESQLASLSLTENETLAAADDHLQAVLFDLLFALSYESRFQHFATDLPETSVTSVLTLSQCLAWHVDPQQWKSQNSRAKAFVVSSYRRVLCLAAYRNIDLCR